MTNKLSSFDQLSSHALQTPTEDGQADIMQAVILAAVVLGILWWWFSRQGKVLQPFGAFSRKSRSYTPQAVPSHLMRRLDSLTRDRRVSARLIERIAASNPGRSRRWCVEKAIYDIQRDRRS